MFSNNQRTPVAGCGKSHENEDENGSPMTVETTKWIWIIGFIVDLPMIFMGIFHRFLYVYQSWTPPEDTAGAAGSLCDPPALPRVRGFVQRLASKFLESRGSVGKFIANHGGVPKILG